jgi:peptidoglycan-N-acetylglucosamine deacetylase
MLARAPSQGGPAKTTASRARTTRSARAMAILLLITSQTVPLTTWAQETSGAQGTSGQLRQCWMPEELRGTPEEKGIVQNVASAYRRPPAGRPQATPLPREWRGAIRRVDLPLGVMKVALTFDLCEQPHEVAGYDGPIIDFLRKTKTRATFFAGGKWIVTHTKRAREVIADPLFEVGNHTWEHRNLRSVRGERLLNEINAAQIAYGQVYAELVRQQCIAPERGYKVQGLDVQPGVPQLFRFPFGACDVQSLRAVADAGLIAIQWDLSSGDPARRLSASHMADAVLRSVRPGSIVLFHANGRGWRTAQALGVILSALRARGYELVTVSDLLNTKGARPVISQTCYDARPGDTNRYDNMARRLEAVYDAFDAKYGSRAPQNRQKVDEPVLVSPAQPAMPRGDGVGQILGDDELNPRGR